MTNDEIDLINSMINKLIPSVIYLNSEEQLSETCKEGQRSPTENLRSRMSSSPRTLSVRDLLILGMGVLCLLTPSEVMGSGGLNEVILNGNTYDNIYIALSPNIPMDQCQTILDDFQAVMNEAAVLLFDLTGSRVTFPSLFRVVLPSTFTECGGYWTSNTTPTGWEYSKAPLRLGPTHPLFGDNMWTRQPGQCGDPGEYISLTPASLTDTSLAARQLVSEWAKYRWGVMDEVGHQGDPVYSPVYEEAIGGSYLPTACTDVPLEYTIANCDSPTSCSVTLDPTNNPSVAASIISVPELPSAVNLCTAATHNTEAPTKQNTLCSKLSASGVFQRHLDFTINPIAPNPTTTVEVTAVLEAPVVSSIVFAVETTERMTQTDYQREYLIDAVCQTIITYLQDGVYFGLVNFGNTATSINDTQPMGVLEITYKRELCNQFATVFINPSTSTNISIVNALTLASEILPPNGVIVLITMPGDSSETVSSAVEAAGTHSVWPVLYPVPFNQDTSWFNTLSAQTGGGTPQSVAQSTDGGNALHPSVRSKLSEALRNTVNSNQPLQLVMDDQDNCVTNDVPKQCSMNLTETIGPSSNDYLLTTYSQSAMSVVLSPSGICSEIENDLSFKTSATFFCPSLYGSVNISVTTVQEFTNVYSEVIAMIEPDVSNTSSVTLWSSSSIKDLRFTNTTAPSMFAQVLYEGREVLQAAVSLTVAIPDRELVTLQLRDDGAGADITGNDGVYSAFLVGVPPNISDVSAGALSLSAQASGPGYFMPEDLTLSTPNECCGSILTLPSSLVATPSFLVAGSAQVKVTSPPPNNLPPGQVTDLQATTSDRSVQLSFTAPGADLDYGTVSGYEVVVYKEGATFYQEMVSNSLVSSGQVQTVYFDKDLVQCDELRSYVVSAFDDQNTQGNVSNVARYTISCSAGEGNSLAAGAITGIVLGVILLLILICLLLFIGFNWEDRDDLLVWQVLTCTTCREEDDDKPSKEKSQSPKKTAQSTGRRPVTIIRSVDDLYSRPVRKRDSRQSPSNQVGDRGMPRRFDGGGVDNRGFNDIPLHRQLSTSVSGQRGRRYSGSSISSKEGFDSVPYDLRDSSLQMTLPINKVGIPVPEFSRVPLHEERFVENPNEYPIYPDVPTSYANPFADPLMDDPYQQPHSDDPSGQFQDYPNMYDSRTNSPRAPPHSRLNTQV